MGNRENLRKDAATGRSPESIFPSFRRGADRNPCPEKKLWEDFAASGDEYNFISTRACELTSESQGGGPPKTRKYFPADQKSAESMKINENINRNQ